ncbi:type III-B CRISPR module-associated protein Cmr3 [Caldisericum sp.]|jgi:CRISPR-associated protein Cmr3|uniref:type III-B CRISPR module-associated protein Cmr3 n=1 Tax=Caldisericum sp. TaxID=2499687 RepID=UPI003D12711F
MTKWIFIEPFDTVFFRDGKPFDAGNDFVSFSIFPPSPSTFYGALRTYIIMQYSNLSNFRSDTKITNVVGTDANNLGSLKIYGPYLYKKELSPFLLFKAPLDIMQRDRIVINLIPSSVSSGLTDLEANNKIKINLALPSDFTSNEAFEEPEEFGDYFTEDEIRAYLSGQFSSIHLKIKDFFKNEHKVGITIDKSTRTAEKHMLYSSPHIRLNNVGFVIGTEDDGNFVSDNGSFHLGGDNRTVRFENIPEFEAKIDSLKQIVSSQLKTQSSKRIKFILLTPGRFKNGWYPDFLNKNNENELEGTLPNTNIKLKLVSCVLGKPDYCGGFDMANKYPKKMEKIVPSGSVYFFEVLNNNEDWINTLLENYFFKSIESDEVLLKQGFGQILIGGWQDEYK